MHSACIFVVFVFGFFSVNDAALVNDTECQDGQCDFEDEDASLLATRVHKQLLESGRRRSRRRQCREMMNQMTCPLASTTTCKPLFPDLPAQQGIDWGSAVGGLILDGTKLAITALVPGGEFISLILGSATSTFMGQKSSVKQNEAIKEYTKTMQTYILLQVQQAQLQSMYQGIIGLQDQYHTAGCTYCSWNGPDHGEHKSDFKTDMGTFISTCEDQYPLFANSTAPWTDPVNSTTTGQKGWGMYFTQFMNLFIAGMMSYIITFPDKESMQENLLTYVSKAVPHAAEIAHEYVKGRESTITPVDYDPHATCQTFENQRITYKFKSLDTFEKCSMDTCNEQCSWSVSNAWVPSYQNTNPGGRYECVGCDDTDVQDQIKQFTKACRRSYEAAVVNPVQSQWYSYLLQPSAQWSKIADEVCAATKFAQVKTACQHRLDKGQQAFGKCCSNRKIQGCIDDTGCDSGTQCVVSQSKGNSGNPVCNTCESRGLSFDPTSNTCVDSAIVLHYVTDCNQCSINWCGNITVNNPNIEVAPNTVMGVDLTALGCDKVDNSMTVYHNSVSSRVYVGIKTYFTACGEAAANLGQTLKWVDAESACQCKSTCMSNKDCQGWTYLVSRKACNLMSSWGKRMKCSRVTPDAVCFSGSVRQVPVFDTPNWNNNYNYTCATYASNGWCANGAFAQGNEWTGSPDVGGGSKCAPLLTSTKTNCAMVYNYPAENCVVCGKQPKDHTPVNYTDALCGRCGEYGEYAGKKTVYCNPTLTKPEQFCPDGTACPSILALHPTACNGDRCECPAFVESSKPNHDAVYCNPQMTGPAQFCPDGTACPAVFAEHPGQCPSKDRCMCPSTK